jgi:hypothetical protein
MEYCLKILEKIVEERLRKTTKIDEMQFGFMPGKSTVDAIFIVRQLYEKALEGNKKLFCAFVDLEKAYDRVPRELIWWCLRKRGVTEKIVRIIKEMYDGAKTKVKTPGGPTDEFEIKVGLHQGSSLSPYLFLLVIDTISETTRKEGVWELLFADDLVLMEETKEKLQERLVEWQLRLENKGLKMSNKKTEVMVCSKEGVESIKVMDKNMNELRQVDSFKYLGSRMDKQGSSGMIVRDRISAAWSKWRELSGVIGDKRIPRQLKVKLYKTVIRPILLYSLETVPLKKEDERN